MPPVGSWLLSSNSQAKPAPVRMGSIQSIMLADSSIQTFQTRWSHMPEA